MTDAKFLCFLLLFGGFSVAWTKEDPLKSKSCRFKTEGGKCCVLPFEFDNKIYTQCTADGYGETWKNQWRNPWCSDKYHVKRTERGQGCIRNAQSCGGERSIPGVISSANYPRGYTNGTECDWLIHIPSANQIILNFTDVSLSLDQSCGGAYVDVYDGDNTTDPLLRRVCGRSLPLSIVSSGNRMLVKFKALETGEPHAKGFRAYYDTGECEVRTYGGNGNGACCVFPFTYKGQVYNTCITKDTDSKHVLAEPWCAVTSNYDRDKKRGLCALENQQCDATREFTCNNNQWWKQCIGKAYRCDGNPECADHSDEQGCPQLVNPYRCSILHILRNRKHPLKTLAWKLKRKCGYKDSCSIKNMTAVNRDAPCNITTWFKCHNGWCVPPEWVCDGKDDCGDRSDESLSRCPYKKQKSSCSWINDCNRWERQFGEGPLYTSTTALCVEPNISTIPTYLPHTTNILYLVGKNIQELNPHNLARYRQLRKLLLNGNRIRKILPYTFANANSLVYLNLANNELTGIQSYTFDGLHSLVNLSLIGNPIKIIEDQGFYGLRKIKELNLTNMKLQTIYSNAFVGMDSLERLYLHNNKDLLQLPLDIFDPVPLEYLKADRFEFCCIAKLSGINCSAPKDLFSSCDDLMANQTLGVSIWILGCIALIGNGFVLIWRLKTKSESKVHSMLLLNLALSDFLMGIYMVVIGSVDKYYRGKYFMVNEEWKRSPLCQFCGFLSTVSCEASVFILTSMTIDRYVAIVHPLRNMSLKLTGTYKVLAAIWSLAFVLAFLPLTGIHYFKDFYGRSGVCLPLHLTAEKPAGWEYSVFVFLVLNFVSFMGIFILYSIMFIKIKQSHQLTGTGVRQRSATASIGSRMVFIVLTDFVCWIPIIIIGIASLSGMQAPTEVYAWVAVFVLPLNSALNPILYTMSTTNFRRHMGARYRNGSKKLQGLTLYTTDYIETTEAKKSSSNSNFTTRTTTTGSGENNVDSGLLPPKNNNSRRSKKCRSCCSPIPRKDKFLESNV